MFQLNLCKLVIVLLLILGRYVLRLSLFIHYSGSSLQKPLTFLTVKPSYLVFLVISIIYIFYILRFLLILSKRPRSVINVLFPCLCLTHIQLLMDWLFLTKSASIYLWSQFLSLVSIPSRFFSINQWQRNAPFSTVFCIHVSVRIHRQNVLFHTRAVSYTFLCYLAKILTYLDLQWNLILSIRLGLWCCTHLRLRTWNAQLLKLVQDSLPPFLNVLVVRSFQTFAQRFSLRFLSASWFLQLLLVLFDLWLDRALMERPLVFLYF